MGRFINGRLVFRAAEINDPELSEVTQIAVESALGCDGEVCRGIDTPHLHLRITGLEPEAGPRYEGIPLDCDEANGR
jgi:hypothetical protein